MSEQYTYPTFYGDKSDFYIATRETSEIVNLAIRLGRPLLVEGEPGCGKTLLASAIAEELGLREHFISTTVKSTSQAKDLLYRFDALRRLQDAQYRDNSNAQHVYPYIDLEPLGNAIWQGKPCLILIDEVDKADIDLPNDLLDVLDNFKFEIEDLPSTESDSCMNARGFGRFIAMQKNSVRPIVIITSNREKQLPEPFLRRCLYIRLEFPKDPETLAEIVKKNLNTTPDKISSTLITEAVKRFCEIRERGRELNMQKLPATSELIDWVRVLHWQGRQSVNLLPDDKLSAIDQAILFKIGNDIERYRARAEEEVE